MSDANVGVGSGIKVEDKADAEVVRAPRPDAPSTPDEGERAHEGSPSGTEPDLAPTEEQKPKTAD